MFQHKDFISANQKVYTYHKNDGTQPNRAWVVKAATCLDALEDEQWDYIFMQQMNHRLALESEFTEYYDSWKYVADYLMNNQDIAPKLGFHVTWTNPDNYELYLNDNAPYKHASSYYWRHDVHEKFWPGADGKYDKSLQYQDINKYVKKYLIDGAEDLIGRNYDLFIPSATVIEYAETVCGRPQQELYRDYTHMNDYGRLIVAYTWYAKIMQLDQIDGINVYEVPKGAHHSNSKYPADLKFDEQMRADALASVNFALANPYLDIANGDPIPGK
jgi:hypothetical protein